MTHPDTTTDASRLSVTLSRRIRQRITQHGALPFSDYMRMALYEPGLGYYSAGLAKFGADGDFITAPELGALFATGFAAAFVTVFPLVHRPVLLEIGAGSGAFARNALLALHDAACLPSHYWILETSAHLRQVQKETLATLPEALRQRIRWLDEPPRSDFEGIVFANEVIDALPVEVFRRNRLAGTGYDRLHVTNKETGFTDHWRPMPASLASRIPETCHALPDGYRSEFLPQLTPWLKEITSGLCRGAVFLVDYGYPRADLYHPDRHTGTLVCHQRHQARFDPYYAPGMQDITAFVDFTAVAESLDAAGLRVTGFTTQGAFLLENGIEQSLGQADNSTYSAYYRRVTEFKQLVLPAEMGEKFKVMLGTRGLSEDEALAIPGFSSDLLYTL